MKVAGKIFDIIVVGKKSFGDGVIKVVQVIEAQNSILGKFIHHTKQV